MTTPKMPMDAPAILTSAEVAELLRVSPRTIRRLWTDGELRGFTVGRRVRFDRRDVDAYIAERRAS